MQTFLSRITFILSAHLKVPATLNGLCSSPPWEVTGCEEETRTVRCGPLGIMDRTKETMSDNSEQSRYPQRTLYKFCLLLTQSSPTPWRQVLTPRLCALITGVCQNQREVKVTFLESFPGNRHDAVSHAYSHFNTHEEWSFSFPSLLKRKPRLGQEFIQSHCHHFT